MRKYVWVLLLLPASVILGKTIPVTRGVTLAGKEIVLPRDLTSGHTVLILGFSEKSAEPCRAWGRKIWGTLCAGEGEGGCYELPVLAGVPRLIRGVVVRGMKKDVEDFLKARFVPVFEKEAEWKRTVEFREPDDAYLLVVKKSGEVEWKGHGGVTAKMVEELKKVVGR